MRPKVLFTKMISNDILEVIFQRQINYDCVAVLEIEIYPKEEILSQIDADYDHYLISSGNSVKAIQDIALKGIFYVVGEKTTRLLKKQGRKIGKTENYADDLADFINKNIEPTSWNFFCGKQRRNELIQKLSEKGHIIQEVYCYESVPQTIFLEEQYDAIAFFSPLSVKTYLKNNVVNKNTVIFTVGKTTSEEVKKHIDNKVITAEIPSVEEVICNIKNYFDVEK